MKHLLLVVILFTSHIGRSQNWEPAGLPITAYEVRHIYTDTIANKLYVVGNISTTGSNGSNIAICVYDGVSWSYLATFNDIILNCITFNGELIVSGMFSSINSQPIQYFAKWDGVSWQQMGGNINAIPYALKVINGELYAGGNFTQIDGQNIPSLAKWDGNSWSAVNNFPGLSSGAISSIETYNGDFYIGGGFSTMTGIDDIAMYKNNVWQRVGTNDTLRGGFTGVSDMVVYKNELIIGGLILKNDGNVGHCIQKWNGSYWSGVGTGVQDAMNTTNTNVQIFSLHVMDDYLFAAGVFDYAGNIPASKVARWDGNYWCGLGGVFNNNALAVGSLNDTLYLGCSDTVDGIFVNNLARWTGGSFIDTCSIPMSIDELNSQNEFSIFPNPNNGNFNLSFNSNFSAATIKIYDGLGRLVYSEKQKNILEGNTLPLQIPQKIPGLYLLSVETEKGVFTSKLLVNE